VAASSGQYFIPHDTDEEIHAAALADPDAPLT
jgi:hypothetical protein